MNTIARGIARSHRHRRGETRRAATAGTRGRSGRAIAPAPGFVPAGSKIAQHSLHQPRLSLRCAAGLLAIIGAVGIALAIILLETSVAVIIGHTDILLVRPNDPLGLVLNVAKPLPGLIILSAGVGSLWVAISGLRGQLSRSDGRTIAAMALMIALDAALALPLFTILSPSAPRPAYGEPTPALDPARFVAGGITGRRAPDQPSRPVTVDRVLVDGTATYVQYHIVDVPHDGQPTPGLTDDRGGRYAVAVAPQVVMTPEEFARQMMPWRAPVRELASFPPLRAGVRSVTLRFVDRLSRPVQAVRILLSRPVNRWPMTTRTAGTSEVAMAVGLTWGVATVRLDLHATVDRRSVPAGGLSRMLPNGPLATVRGHPIETLNSDTACRAAPRGDATCDLWATFASPPPMTRIVVAIPGVILYDEGGEGHPIPCPTRLIFAAPRARP